MTKRTVRRTDVPHLESLAGACDNTLAALGELRRAAAPGSGLHDVVERLEQRYRCTAGTLRTALGTPHGEEPDSPASDPTPAARAEERAGVRRLENRIARTLTRFHQSLNDDELSRAARLLVAFEYHRLCTGATRDIDALRRRAA